MSHLLLLRSGGRTRTSDLRVMSPTSYRLLYPAMLFGTAKVGLFPEIAKIFFRSYFKNSRMDSVSPLSKAFCSPETRFLTLICPAAISFPPVMERNGIVLRSA